MVGGGAAGLVAAWRAATLGHSVRLLEANGRLGVKLRISGGGKCNITHDGTPQALLAAFSKAQGRFLRPSFHAFDNGALLALLRREGVETYTRDNGRVFPLDRPGSAAAVVAALETLARRAGVEVHTGARVTALKGTAPRLEALLLDGGANPHRLAASWLKRVLPERLVEALLQEAGLGPDLRLKDLPKAGRRAMVALVTELDLGEPQAVPLARGEVAAGGVELGAVDPRTMALRGWENLRVCGELLDIDGPVGGYNLQAAFSTGFTAGSLG